MKMKNDILYHTHEDGHNQKTIINIDKANL